MHNRVHFVKPEGDTVSVYDVMRDKFDSNPERSVVIHDSLPDFRKSYRGGIPHRGDVVVVQDNGELTDFNPVSDAEYLILRGNGYKTVTPLLPPDNVTLYDMPEDLESIEKSVDILSKKSLQNKLNTVRTKRKNAVGIEGATGDVGRRAAIGILEHNEHTSSDTVVYLLEYGPDFGHAFDSIASDNPIVEEQYRKGNLRRGSLRDIVENCFLTLTFQANSSLEFSDNRDDHLKANMSIYEARQAEIMSLLQGQVPIHIIGSNYPEGIARKLYDAETDLFFKSQRFSVAGHDISRGLKGAKESVDSEEFDRNKLVNQRVDQLFARLNFLGAGTHKHFVPLLDSSIITNGDSYSMREAFGFTKEDSERISSFVTKQAQANKKPNFSPTDYIAAVVQTVDAFQRGGPVWLSGPVSWDFKPEVIDFDPAEGEGMAYGISRFDTTNIANPVSLFSSKKAKDKYVLSRAEISELLEVLEREKDHLNMLNY